MGVPVTTRIGQSYGWQWPYAAVGVIALLTVLAVWRWVPFCPPDGGVSLRSELSALKRPQVWLALGIGTVGFGGMFATFSYISPTMTELGGFGRATIPLILALYGVGMTIGAILSGPVSRIGLIRAITVPAGGDRRDAVPLRPGRAGGQVVGARRRLPPRAAAQRRSCRCCRPG